jgi:hypothetical protein
MFRHIAGECNGSPPQGVRCGCNTEQRSRCGRYLHEHLRDPGPRQDALCSHHADLLRSRFAGAAFAISSSIRPLETVNFGMPIFLRACEDTPVCAKTSGAVLTACMKGNMQWAVRCTSGRRKPGGHDIPVTLNTNLQLTSAVYP